MDGLARNDDIVRLDVDTIDIQMSAETNTIFSTLDLEIFERSTLFPFASSRVQKPAVTGSQR